MRKKQRKEARKEKQSAPNACRNNRNDRIPLSRIRYPMEQPSTTTSSIRIQKFIQKSDPAKLEAALQKAHEYNQYRAHGPILDPWLSRITDDNEKYKEYLSLLNLSSTMARIVIPDIHVNLPIFHGTRPNALENGVGHLFGTDLPVGGTSTHSVLTAHTGLRTATLFDNLIDLKKGQSIYIEIYGQRLRYVVKDTEVVLPEETDSLHKITGKDILTLVTCTPYGVNSHRLLVHAERAPLDEENAKILDTASGFHLQWWMWLFLGGALIALLEVINILRKNRKNKKSEMNQKKQSQISRNNHRQEKKVRESKMNTRRSRKNSTFIAAGIISVGLLNPLQLPEAAAETPLQNTAIQAIQTATATGDARRPNFEIPCTDSSLRLRLPQPNPFDRLPDSALKEPTGAGFEITLRQVAGINLNDPTQWEKSASSPSHKQTHSDSPANPTLVSPTRRHK
ncbi:class C sortase [Arcanobacterium hippocoleae]|uniref:class C sortase n=1 Tax=Arcanobacterium hippocoleae TaxID=149017 RepID=UPI00333F9AEB